MKRAKIRYFLTPLSTVSIFLDIRPSLPRQIHLNKMEAAPLAAYGNLSIDPNSVVVVAVAIGGSSGKPSTFSSKDEEVARPSMVLFYFEQTMIG